MYKYDVSIILVTYNSNLDKLDITLNMALSQKNVKYEIIVCDDCSKNSPIPHIEECFRKHGFEDYLIIEHEHNLGTVNNLYSGIIKSTGEYCYGMSAGDILYDETTLESFVRHCRENNIDICFGNAVYYKNENNNIKVMDCSVNQPQNPAIYKKHDRKQQLIALYADPICGASYFRKTEVLKEILQKIKNVVKYGEDTPSSMVALAEGKIINHYDRKLLWYEYGTGISTSRKQIWHDRIHKDIVAIYGFLKKEYPQNPVIDMAFFNATHKNRIVRYVRSIIFHPVVSAKVFKNRRKKNSDKVDYDDEIKLKRIFMDCKEK